MAYTYLLGSLAYLFVWSALFLTIKRIRRPMLVGGILGLPLGFAEVFFTEYWNPLWTDIELVQNLYLADLILCFSLGGLAIGGYTFFKDEKKSLALTPWIIIIIPLCIGVALIDPLGWTFMNYMLVSMAAGSLYVLSVHPGRKEIALSAFIINLLYSGIFACIWLNFPLVKESYLLENLWGFAVFGMPLEEFVWVFLLSIIWAPVYESVEPFLNKVRRANT